MLQKHQMAFSVALLVVALVASCSGQRRTFYSSWTYTTTEYLLERVSASRDSRNVCTNPLYLGYSAEGRSESPVLRQLKLLCSGYPTDTRSDWRSAYENAMRAIDRCEEVKCLPRDTVVDVPYRGSGSYYPNCTVVKRCSGCCTPGSSCSATRTSTKAVQVVEVVDGALNLQDVSVEVHEECSCDSGRPTCAKLCRPPFYLNEEACRCECRDRRCPAYFELDPSTCECRCNRDCGSNAQLDLESCTCRPTCARYCNPPFVLDSQRCTCVCNRDCGPYADLDATTCTCQPRNPTCTLYCNSPFVLDRERCRCVCNRDCGPNGQLEPSSCTCRPICTRYCNPPFELDRENCRCVCNRDCGPNGQLESSTCTCRPTCTRYCYPPFELDRENCRCVCNRDCGPNAQLDPSSCTCRPTCTRYCNPPFELDRENCRCVCNRDCGSDAELDPASCTCRPVCTRSCFPPFYLDRPSCSCRCGLSSSDCQAGETLDISSCRCTGGCGGVQRCESPYERFNPSTCACECQYTAESGNKPSCQPGTDFDYCDCDCISE